MDKSSLLNMKKIVALFSLMMFAVIYQTQAQSTPVVDQRQQNQRHRIQQGVVSGELTRGEAADARHDQRKIRRSERRAKADGVVTPSERVRLNHKQNRASRKLRRDKHDAQDRP
jgi:hypothetical protein